MSHCHFYVVDSQRNGRLDSTLIVAPDRLIQGEISRNNDVCASIPLPT
jgi:hypothetical protein